MVRVLEVEYLYLNGCEQRLSGCASGQEVTESANTLHVGGLAIAVQLAVQGVVQRTVIWVVHCHHMVIPLLELVRLEELTDGPVLP